MRRIGFAVVACIGMIGLLGCDQGGSDQTGGAQPQQQAGRVAVIDLQEVADKLGRIDEIGEALKAEQADLRAGLGTAQTRAQEVFDEAKAEYDKKLEALGEDVADDDPEKVKLDQQLGLTVRNLRGQLNQLQQRAQNELGQKQRKMLVRFREQVRPHARRIAEERGLTVVIPKSESTLFAFVPEVDITDAVSDEMMLESQSE